MKIHQTQGGVLQKEAPFHQMEMDMLQRIVNLCQLVFSAENGRHIFPFQPAHFKRLFLGLHNGFIAQPLVCPYTGCMECSSAS